MIMQFTEGNTAGIVLQVASTDWFKLVKFMDVSTAYSLWGIGAQNMKF